MRIRHLVLPFALFAAAPVTAQSTQEFHSAAGYTLQIPAGWRRLPESEVNLLRQSSAQAVARAFEAAYKVTHSRARIPFMAVATIDLGRQLTVAQFREQTTGPRVQAQMQAASDAVIEPGRTARTGVPTWDEENGAAWTRVAHRSDGRSPPFTWSVGMLHPNRHTVIMLIYTGGPGEDEARVRADLLAIVRSLRVD